MTEDQPIELFDWFANQFTVDNRGGFIVEISPHLNAFLKPGDNVLDLCCGAGPITLFLEEQGARVTGIDLAPGLIGMARQEAQKRNSRAKFIQASVFSHPLGNGEYDLAVCFGNAILDFPHENFLQFRDRVYQALKPGGRLVIEYVDGLLRVSQMSEPKEVVESGVGGQIMRRFQGYDPVTSAYTMVYRHLSGNETVEYVGYVYTGPMIRLVMEAKFQLERSIRLCEERFMDVYVKV